jgi:ribosome-associated protein
MLYVNEKISIPRSEITFTFARSPGPGGQNVNKVNSKAVLRWPVQETQALPYQIKQRFIAKYTNRITGEGIFVMSSHRYRDQPRNVNDCLEKLKRLILAVVDAPKPRKKTKPSAGAKRRRLEGKKRRSATKKLRGRVGLD